MKLVKPTITIFIIFFQLIIAKAQFNELKIGDVVPSHIFLKDLKNYGVKNPIIDHFKGKLLILDFWSTGCSNCIAAMPKMEALQQRFGDSIQIILINPWESKERIEQRTRQMKSYRPGIGLSSLPMVNGDVIWKLLFPHRTVPHHVWIDGTGKVIAITNGYNTTEENISKTLRGAQPALSIKKDLAAYGYNPWKDGIFTVAHSSLLPTFQSGFVRYNAGFGAGNAILIDTPSQTYHRMWLNNNIQSFYEYAYAVPGKRNRTIVEVEDKTMFDKAFQKNNREVYYKNMLYSYQITLTLAEKENLKAYVQQDLNRFFGVEKGIVGGLEKRTFSCIALKVKKKGLLKSLGEKKSHRYQNDSLIFKNTPFRQVISVLQGKVEDVSKRVFVVDDTGFSDNVDITLTGDLNDIENLSKQLAYYGIALKMGKRKLEVLVIKEKE